MRCWISAALDPVDPVGLCELLELLLEVLELSVVELAFVPRILSRASFMTSGLTLPLVE